MSVTILLPLDGSAFSEHALPAALELARRLGARLHLVHVHESPSVLAGDGAVMVEAQLGQALRAQEEEYLSGVASRCQAQGVSARTALLEGPVATALATYIQDAAITLVAMTTHGRGGISRAWVGSVADAVVRRASVPVLLLRPHDGELEGPVLECDHVLVTLDGSPLAEGILEPLGLLCRAVGPSLTLLRVVSPLQLLATEGEPATLSQDPAAVAQAVEGAHVYLEAVATPLRGLGIIVKTAIEVHSVPAVAILDYAATHAVNAIAMATHGRGGWSRVALGSVADKVMRGTLMPVLLYRPPAARAEAEPLSRRPAQALEH